MTQDSERGSNRGLLIALIGAESTGKSQLAHSLSEALAQATGLRSTVVPETLRDWCQAQGRTPRPEEQGAIAEAQAQKIDTAALAHDLVICDTTPLMTATYSQILFQDNSLWPMALAFQRRCALTLLTALDLPWVADGIQRDGPQVQAPVDNAIRQALIKSGLGWSVVSGSGAARLDSALNAVTPVLTKQRRQPPGHGLFTRLNERQTQLPNWTWACEKCDDPECEHRSLQARRP
ncbi:ATP-binding protein [Roseateles koreensis]|uniref:ATP-binding protein n=1 Tax=Roseateles koreensis TaxID=2987526 RepID=A0ABT5KQ89_9BURK|nr:ATP-binding protein [Roseateles koreensis]MDC8785079.1 ATP-binding protein [Roseateles koreensis]